MKSGSHKTLTAFAWAVLGLGVVLFIYGLSIWREGPSLGEWVVGVNVGGSLMTAGWNLVLIGLVLGGINLAVSSYRTYAVAIASAQYDNPPAPPQSGQWPGR